MEYEESIIKVLKDGGLSTEDLLDELGIEPCGGELVAPIRRLMGQGIVKRHETFSDENELIHESFVYELCG